MPSPLPPAPAALARSRAPFTAAALAAALAEIAVEYERQAVGAPAREQRRLTLAAQAARVLHEVVREVERQGPSALHDAARRVERFTAWIEGRAGDGDAAHAVALSGAVAARLAAA